MLPETFRPGIRICGVIYGPQQATVDEIVEAGRAFLVGATFPDGQE
jgi:hypothetical protein